MGALPKEPGLRVAILCFPSPTPESLAEAWGGVAISVGLQQEAQEAVPGGLWRWGGCATSREPWLLGKAPRVDKGLYRA